jgi:hypothetical protein
MMITEVETLYDRLDRMRMSPADRHLAKASLEQAEAFAEFLHRALHALTRLSRGRSAQAPHSPDLGARASS